MKTTTLVLALFAIYILAAAVYAGWCWHDSNARIAEIEREFQPVSTSVSATGYPKFQPITAPEPAPGTRLSPVRTSPWYPAVAK